MPRRTPIREIQKEEVVPSSPLRRSSRLSNSSPVPTKVVSRRNSATETPTSTPTVTRTRRSSFSQESSATTKTRRSSLSSNNSDNTSEEPAQKSKTRGSSVPKEETSVVKKNTRSRKSLTADSETNEETTAKTSTSRTSSLSKKTDGDTNSSSKKSGSAKDGATSTPVKKRVSSESPKGTLESVEEASKETYSPEEATASSVKKRKIDLDLSVINEGSLSEEDFTPQKKSRSEDEIKEDLIGDSENLEKKSTIEKKTLASDDQSENVTKPEKSSKTIKQTSNNSSEDQSEVVKPSEDQPEVVKPTEDQPEVVKPSEDKLDSVTKLEISSKSNSETVENLSEDQFRSTNKSDKISKIDGKETGNISEQQPETGKKSTTNGDTEEPVKNQSQSLIKSDSLLKSPSSRPEVKPKDTTLNTTKTTEIESSEKNPEDDLSFSDTSFNLHLSSSLVENIHRDDDTVNDKENVCPQEKSSLHESEPEPMDVDEPLLEASSPVKNKSPKLTKSSLKKEVRDVEKITDEIDQFLKEEIPFSSNQKVELLTVSTAGKEKELLQAVEKENKSHSSAEITPSIKSNQVELETPSARGDEQATTADVPPLVQSTNDDESDGKEDKRPVVTQMDVSADGVEDEKQEVNDSHLVTRANDDDIKNDNKEIAIDGDVTKKKSESTVAVGQDNQLMDSVNQDQVISKQVTSATSTDVGESIQKESVEVVTSEVSSKTDIEQLTSQSPIKVITSDEGTVSQVNTVEVIKSSTSENEADVPKSFNNVESQPLSAKDQVDVEDIVCGDDDSTEGNETFICDESLLVTDQNKISNNETEDKKTDHSVSEPQAEVESNSTRLNGTDVDLDLEVEKVNEHQRSFTTEETEEKMCPNKSDINEENDEEEMSSPSPKKLRTHYSVSDDEVILSEKEKESKTTSVESKYCTPLRKTKKSKIKKIKKMAVETIDLVSDSGKEDENGAEEREIMNEDNLKSNENVTDADTNTETEDEQLHLSKTTETFSPCHDNSIVTNSLKKRSSDRTSLTLQETIKADEENEKNVSERIHNVVDLFCAGIKNKSDVSISVSMEYVGQMTDSDDEETEKFNISLTASTAEEPALEYQKGSKRRKISESVLHENEELELVTDPSVKTSISSGESEHGLTPDTKKKGTLKAHESEKEQVTNSDKNRKKSKVSYLDESDTPAKKSKKRRSSSACDEADKSIMSSPKKKINQTPFKASKTAKYSKEEQQSETAESSTDDETYQSHESSRYFEKLLSATLDDSDVNDTTWRPEREEEPTTSETDDSSVEEEETLIEELLVDEQERINKESTPDDNVFHDLVKDSSEKKKKARKIFSLSKFNMSEALASSESEENAKTLKKETKDAASSKNDCEQKPKKKTKKSKQTCFEEFEAPEKMFPESSETKKKNKKRKLLPVTKSSSTESEPGTASKKMKKKGITDLREKIGQSPLRDRAGNVVKPSTKAPFGWHVTIL